MMFIIRDANRELTKILLRHFADAEGYQRPSFLVVWDTFWVNSEDNLLLSYNIYSPKARKMQSKKNIYLRSEEFCLHLYSNSKKSAKDSHPSTITTWQYIIYIFLSFRKHTRLKCEQQWWFDLVFMLIESHLL